MIFNPDTSRCSCNAGIALRVKRYIEQGGWKKTFHDLFEKRHSGDYDDFVFCDKEMVDELYPRAVKFIDDVKNLLQ